MTCLLQLTAFSPVVGMWSLDAPVQSVFNSSKGVFSWLATGLSDLGPANPPRVLMIQRSFPLDRPAQLVAFQVESGQAEQLAAIELPGAKGDLDLEPSAAALSRRIKSLWNQLTSLGTYSEVLVLEPGLVRSRLALSPAPAIVLSLPKMAIPSDQWLQPLSTTWPVEPQWLEWLDLYGLDHGRAVTANSKPSDWSSTLRFASPQVC